MLRVWVVGLFLSTAVYPQQRTVCPLDMAKNGDLVTLKAEAVHGAHDGLLRVSGCADEILFEYADDPNFRGSKLQLKKDEALRQLKEYFGAEQPEQPNVVCRGCWKYRVVAEFVGRLDIAESAGWKKDAKTGKLTGLVGFGHPVPFTRYRLVITSVSSVQATEK